jgi:hypothetical protein
MDYAATLNEIEFDEDHIEGALEEINVSTNP